MESQINSNRFFFEVSYKGTNYSGFQKQNNANTIQNELENALHIYYKQTIELTGSSRTDAGVHAMQNYFHADLFDLQPTQNDVYSLNAILPSDICLKQIFKVPPTYHARFSATARLYKYYISTQKNPFTQHTAWHYPYKTNQELLNNAAQIISVNNNFQSFSKLHTNVANFNCTIQYVNWQLLNHQLVFTIQANRFLRGMVRAIVGTTLLVGREKITLQQLQNIINAANPSLANFSTPAHGLFLEKVFFENL